MSATGDSLHVTAIHEPDAMGARNEVTGCKNVEGLGKLSFADGVFERLSHQQRKCFGEQRDSSRELFFPLAPNVVHPLHSTLRTRQP